MEKGVHDAGEAIGEIGPHNDAGQVEQDGWDSASGNARNFSKNNKVNERRQEWLEEYPNRTQYGLLITCDDIPSDKSQKQVLILEKLLKI
jgi:hypothetical protein